MFLRSTLFPSVLVWLLYSHTIVSVVRHHHLLGKKRAQNVIKEM